MSGRLSQHQTRILGFAWVGLVVLVSACILIGVNLALRSSSTAILSVETLDNINASPTPASLSMTQSGAETVPTPLPQPDLTFGYGIQVTLQTNTRSALNRVETLGLGWVKYDISWADFEPVPGQAQWETLDAVFQSTSARNLKVLISVSDAPNWSRITTEDVGPPHDSQLYVNYISQIVQRYPGAIHGVEIWRGANLQKTWHTEQDLSPEAYFNLVRSTSQTIRQLNPSIMIMSGALTPTGVDDGVLAVDDFRYMQQLINLGMLNTIDCVGVRHIGYNLPPDISSEDAFALGPSPGTLFIGPFNPDNPLNPHHSWSFYTTFTGYHDMIVSAGANTPLCVTEFGWASADGIDDEPPPAFEFAYDNSAQEQATYIAEAFRLMHNWGFVRMAILYNLDHGLNTEEDSLNGDVFYSILTPSGTARPAFEVVRDMPKPP